MKIVFMGTPEFSQIVLKSLCENGLTPSAVVTRADKPAGRGYSLSQSPVKKYALSMGIDVYQPEKMSDPVFLSKMKEIAPDLIVVVAYGKILPESILNLPRFACINAHASLLPLYRGAAPMQRAIMDERTETGVTVMKMEKGLDTGDMILSLKTPISDQDTLETIHDRLASLSGTALIQAINQIEKGVAVYTKQDDSLSTYAEKIRPDDEIIDFSKSCTSISAQIRALTPFPFAHCNYNGKRLKITSAVAHPDISGNSDFGTVTNVTKKSIFVSCGKGTLEILGVFPESKRRMTASDFINGSKIKSGDKFN